MFKAKLNNLPYNLQKLFQTANNVRYGTRQQDNFRQNSVRTDLKKMSLSINGVKIWNSLNDRLKRMKSENTFKKFYKLNIFEDYSLL